MRCPKCQGLVVLDHDELRCLNCGMRPGDGTRQVGEIGVGRPIGHNLRTAPAQRIR